MTGGTNAVEEEVGKDRSAVDAAKVVVVDGFRSASE